MPASKWSAGATALLLLWLAAFPAAAAERLESNIEFTQEEEIFLRDHPVIRVHNETDWPPFNFSEGGKPLGYSIDFMNLLAARTGLQVEYVTGPSWNDFLDMMKAGTLDVMLNIVKTPDRQKYLLYTPPYADNPNTILSRKEDAYDSLSQLFGKTVSVPKGFFYEEVLKREFPQIKLHLVKGTLDTMKAVVFGKADAAVGELAVFNHLLDRHLMTGLVVSGEVKMGDPELSLLNIATRKDLPVLASILTKAVDSVAPEERAAIENKWVSLQHGLGVDTVLVVRVGIGFSVIVLLIFIWNRRLQREVKQRKLAEVKMEAAKNEAERLTQAKSDFIAVISHEIRTPMNGVLGMARLLMETSLDKEQRECVDTVVESGEALLTIIDDLLDISKLDAGKLEIESLSFIVNDVIEHSIALMKSRADERGLALNTVIDAQIPGVVVGDPLRLRQIILNLVSNAIKFTDEGSVTVEARTESQTADAAVLSFTVTDTGKGMAPETMENLFSAYSQGSAAVARKYGGTGLGLAICRRLATMMNGNITVESVVDKGSVLCFKANFQIDKVTDAASLRTEDASHPSSTAIEQTARPLSVLQVEDNETNRTVIERILSRVGHTVSSVVNGAEALEALKAGEFDVILMDRHMPVMDGIEATRRIREMDGPVASMPIFGITASASQADIDDCIRAGMDDCFTKPVEVVKLRALLENLGDGNISPSPAPSPDGKGTIPASATVFPVDLDYLARILGEDDEDELFFMLGIFHNEFPKLLASLEAAIRERDARSVHDRAHAAKGAATNAAALALTGMLQELETDAHLENWAETEARTDAIKSEYARVVRFCEERRQGADKVT